MLQEINSRLRDVGHVPDLDSVPLDVDEKKKEYLLSRHSEKVAIASGFIGRGEGVPICMVKNLRMCCDCHSFAKLVSRIYDREVIVQDNNTFHFFRQGLCSCSDYW
ncbi:putative DYW domain-containing protein [Rosa chinensis]|uniref:Putative DYW domain-containing protein n=1 Tax=Rosa chinensis TaxID=74649 RepID=A0A2P6QPP4_ROSCH|nr:putative DYW domain-containing protein [Rosa chinensis]